MVLAILGQATYRRLFEARKSSKNIPASQAMNLLVIYSSALTRHPTGTPQFCPNQAPHLLLATLGQATYMKLEKAIQRILHHK